MGADSETWQEILASGRCIAGVDEAGRGPLAGPVMAAAVILPPSYQLPGLTDSKQLSASQRARLETQIKSQALAWAVASATAAEIDDINILQASLLAMRRAIESLLIVPEIVLVDGTFCPVCAYPSVAVVKGDSKVPAISAASILAKETRDRLMREYDTQYPAYGFALHKGYPTARHIHALNEHGACSIHRRSFAPVRRCAAGLRKNESPADK